MGMAASQARYLALVARKSNCEYEGQQINQARTALSNQSADLFNQMLGLQVPTPPSTRDFTKTQYSFTDGYNASTISSWQQLSVADPDYNYIVTHHYYADKFTGSMKKLNDPQVQFNPTPADQAQLQQLYNDMMTAYQDFLDADMLVQSLQSEFFDLDNYIDSQLNVTGDGSNKNVTIKGSVYTSFNINSDGKQITPLSLTDYEAITGDTSVREAVATLWDNGLFEGRFTDLNDALSYVRVNYGPMTNDNLDVDDNFFFVDDCLNALVNGTELSFYDAKNINSLPQAIADRDAKQQVYENSIQAYNDALGKPEYIGNTEVTELTALTEDQEAEIRQIVLDLQEQGIDAEILNCYDPVTGTYSGGLYTFQMGGVTYYTTYNDLYDSYTSGTGHNLIDGQTKLSYYNATYISTKIEKTEKALLETDENGRFSSVRFESDTATYKLNMETITDEEAYNDAMNQYYYDNDLYDKTIRDINAKTSLIQQQDQQLELRLKQLDTEQSALSTEIDAVKKVVDDNVEKSFKTFGG